MRQLSSTPLFTELGWKPHKAEAASAASAMISEVRATTNPTRPINTVHPVALTFFDSFVGRHHACQAIPASVKAGMATVAEATRMMSVSIVLSACYLSGACDAV
jgi:hypothetical protein